MHPPCPSPSAKIYYRKEWIYRTVDVLILGTEKNGISSCGMIISISSGFELLMLKYIRKDVV